MSERTRRILKLASTTVSYDLSEDEYEEPYSASESSYVPSTDGEDDDSNQDSAQSIIKPNLLLLEPVLKSPNIVEQVPIVIPFDKIDRGPGRNLVLQTDDNREKEKNYMPLSFEFENNFTDNNLITDNDIQKLNQYYPQEGVVIDENSNIRDKIKRNNEGTQINTVQSSLLTENKYKKTTCKFCDTEVISKHFARHLQRNHADEKEVKEIFSLEARSTERKRRLSLLRNAGNMDPAIRGHIIPKKRQMQEINEKDYAICVHCNGFYKRLCLSRHVKKCFAKDPQSVNTKNQRPLAESLVYSATLRRYGQMLNSLSVKTEIFSKMQADIITATVINDSLLILFGEDLLKKSKNKRSMYHLSNKLRECGKFLLEMRQLGTYSDMLSTLKPENFDDAIEATKKMSRYDVEKRSFGAASLALHFGTTLKKLSDLAQKLILRKKIPLSVTNVESTLTALKRFKKIVESQWTTELGSLALKDLNEKAAIKPKLLPVTEDIMKLKKFVEDRAEESYEQLKTSKTMSAYKILVETTLVLSIIHNRKRVGDIQYLDLKSYSEQMDNSTNATVQTEMATSLSENEKILTQHYKRIVSIGKGSRAVTILIPKNIQKYFNMIHSLRKNTTWFPNSNVYFFTNPKSTRWLDGCSTIRKYAKQCHASHPELLTSCRLRKHIATVTQILSLKSNEIEQLAKFMGHTTKTHETFYKLPQDVYQVAKVSKILQLIEKGNVAEFKNKCLEEIDIDMENIDDLSVDPVDPEDLEPDLTQNLDSPTPSTSKKDTSEAPQSTENLITDFESNNLDTPTTSKNSLPKDFLQKKSSRQRWNGEQKKLMLHYFRDNVKQKRALKKKECEEFLKKYNNKFEGVGWVRVKTFIFNEYRIKE